MRFMDRFALALALLAMPATGAVAETPVERGRYLVTPIVHVPEPSRADKVAYGAYLSGPVGHCVLCHTPPGGGKPFDMSLAYLGGRELPDFDHPGGVAVSRNITAGSKHGIGGWTDAQIKRAITDGIRPDGTHLSRTMPFAW